MRTRLYGEPVVASCFHERRVRSRREAAQILDTASSAYRGSQRPLRGQRRLQRARNSAASSPCHKGVVRQVIRGVALRKDGVRDTRNDPSCDCSVRRHRTSLFPHYTPYALLFCKAFLAQKGGTRG